MNNVDELKKLIEEDKEEERQEKRRREKELYHKNKEKNKDYSKYRAAQQKPIMLAKRKENKARAVAHLGGKCMRCSGVFPTVVYDFHHYDPSIKEVAVSRLWARSWEDVLVEVNKCKLLCSNCHRIEHYEKGNEDV